MQTAVDRGAVPRILQPDLKLSWITVQDDLRLAQYRYFSQLWLTLSHLYSKRPRVPLRRLPSRSQLLRKTAQGMQEGRDTIAINPQ